MRKNTPLSLSPCHTRSRRAFLKTGVGLIAIAGAWPFALHSSDLEQDGDLAEDLADIMFDFFPHLNLSPALYRQAALNALASSPEPIARTVAELKSLARCKRWAEADKQARKQAIKAIQGSPSFYLIRSSTVQVIYRAPDTFRLLGYGGSSIEHGGYLLRGFNDIDWLPQGK